MLVDVGVKFFSDEIRFIRVLETEVNSWLAANRDLYISNVEYRVVGDRVLVFVTYGREKER